MKNFPLKKFSKKYLFLQNSLLDFVSWRSRLLQNLTFSSYGINRRLESESQPKVFEQKNNKKKGQKRFLTTHEQKTFRSFHRTYGLHTEKLTFQTYWQTSNVQKLHTLLRTFQRNRFFQKQQHISSNRFASSFSTSKFLNFQTQKRKLFSFSMSENSIPESDYFRNIEKFNFFETFQLGNFFPRKQLFQQYWIVPFFGFIYFFSGNFSCFHVSPDSLFSQKPPKLFFSSNQQISNSLPLTNSESGQSYFYPNKTLNHWYKVMKDYEQTELKDLFHFYLQNFENSEIFKTSFGSQNFVDSPLFFSKYIQKSSKVFFWQWFHVSFLENLPLPYSLNLSELPQKADFFFLESSPFFPIQKIDTFSEKTPLFEFLKNRFFLNNVQQSIQKDNAIDILFFNKFFRELQRQEKHVNHGIENSFLQSFSYLEKWFQTQTFFKFNTNSQLFFAKNCSDPDFFVSKCKQFAKNKPLFIFKNQKVSEQIFGFLNTLDSLYLQKNILLKELKEEKNVSFLLKNDVDSYSFLTKQTLKLSFLNYYLKTLNVFQKISRPQRQSIQKQKKQLSFFEILKDKKIKKIEKLESPLLFHFSSFENEKKTIFPDKVEKIENIQPMSTYSNSFSLSFPLKNVWNISKKNSSFTFSNHDFFEKWFHLQSTKFFENFSKTCFFENSFFRERHKKKTLGVFQPKQTYLFQSVQQKTVHPQNLFFVPQFKTVQIELKQKKKFCSNTPPQNFSKSVNQIRLQNSKFEKVFYSFFSPLVSKNSHDFSNYPTRFAKKRTDKMILENLKNTFRKEVDFIEFFSMQNFQKNDFVFQDKETPVFSPIFLLKREGFITPSSLRLNAKFRFFSEVQNSETFQRLQKEKNFQKRRRLKKQKLETRRRKKRKRFYPRPIWLRFHLYKKFLQIRHPSLEFQIPDFPSNENNKTQKLLQQQQKTSRKAPFSTFLKLSNSRFSQTVFQKNFMTNTNIWKQKISEKEILKTTCFPLSFCFDNQLTEKLLTQQPLSQNIEDYKLSSELLSDFLRFSWKSTWFQQNYQAYKHSLTKHFQTMKTFEKDKLFHQLFSDSSVFQQKTNDLAGKDGNDFFLNDAITKKFFWYLNNQYSFSSSEIQKNFLNLSLAQTLPAYNQFVSSRIETLLKTLKFSENHEDLFSSAFQPSVYKIDSKFGNLSFFTKMALFFENFQIPSQPIIPAFSVFSTIFHNFSEKPSGEMPTLRSLWAFQQTNFSHFQETNFMRNFWTTQKKIDSLKSFKGIKNCLRFFERYQNSEEFQIPSFSSSKNFSFFLRPTFQAQIDSSTHFFQNQPFKIQSRIFFEQLDRVTLQKFLTIQKKCSLYGIHSLKQNSKLSLRYLKFHFGSPFYEKEQLNKETQGTLKTFVSPWSATNIKKIENLQNSSMSSLNFWWNKKTSLSPFSISQAQDQPLEEFMNKTPFFQNLPNQTFLNFNIENQFLFFGTVLFHLAIFLTFLKLPQIRSLLKFQFLLFSKFFQSTFFVVFSVSYFFEEVMEQSKQAFTKFSRQMFSNSSFSEELFSRTKYIQMKNFLHVPVFFTNFDSVVQNLSKQKIQNQSIFFEFFIRFSNFSLEKNFSGTFQTFSNVLSLSDQFLFSPLSFFLSSQIKILNDQSFSANNLNTLSTFPFQFSLNLFEFENFGSFQSRKIFSLKKPFFLSEVKSFSKVFDQKKLPKQENLKTLNFGATKFFYFLSSNVSNEIRQQKRQKIFLPKLSLCSLKFAKTMLQGGSLFVHIGSSSSSKLFDIFEFFFFSIYKFLEKPAELIIEWIALVFLIEWTADVPTFLPESYDNLFWKSSQKVIRPLQTGNILFTFFLSTFGSFEKALHPSFFHSFVGLTTLNIHSWFLRKKLISLFEIFLELSLQPDIDILTRQKKGMIFWDIWAEILLKAAEKYNVNIPSFVTLKEEQELFLEKLLQDPQFLESLSSSTFDQNFSAFTEKFFLPTRPRKLFDSQFFQPASLPMVFQDQKKAENLDQLSFVSSFSFSRSSLIANQKNMASLLFVNFLKNPNKNLSQTLHQIQDRWSCNQYGIAKGSETDLFIDIHPPKSFEHIKFFQYYDPAQYLIGSLMCQLSSGLFPKQISKNILVIGELGTAKTLFLQALAGESEMKILTDNAYRYASVQKGVAVGMKYLRDVFDSIALQTPCFFVMENIHVIGAKRPFLLSDDDHGKDSFFGAENQEVHESNQLIYHLTRHSLTDFKRPYKGDFSMAIPSNSFLQGFYSQSENTFGTLFKNSQFSGGFDTNSRPFLSSPFPLQSLEYNSETQNSGEIPCSKSQHKFPIRSFLQLSPDQIFAPPATSPFTVLMLKEQKKLKPLKTVQEFSWGGLSTDQMISYQKESYSVRSKVAILAEMTMNLSRGKLDMITDLLVIIDSVRSNRGFIVFATTHLPSVLDPALRRPGRFDETLSLAQSPNFLNRFELFKMNFKTSLSTLDFFDTSLGTENFSELDLLNLIQETKLSFFHPYKISLPSNLLMFNQKIHQNFSKRLFSYESPTNAFVNFLKSPFFSNFYSRKYQKQKTFAASFFPNTKNSNLFFTTKNLQGSEISLLRNLTYSKIGIFLFQTHLFCDPTSFSWIAVDLTNFYSDQKTFKNYLGTVLYQSQEEQKMQCGCFLAGKILESFWQQNTIVDTWISANFQKQESQFNQKKHPSFSDIFVQKFSFFSNRSKQSGFENQKTDLHPPTQTLQIFQENSFSTTFGTDESWRFVTSFLVSLLSKRFFFTKNILLSKMLFLENKNQRKQPSSPPNSSILMPGRKYENFKRTEYDFSKKPFFSIQEKIQAHQKQRFLKQLYNVTAQSQFPSQRIQHATTSFSTSFAELAYIDNFLERTSSTNFYQKKYFTIRHNFSHSNLWWNGMFPEHNVETTYLSDVDWRTMFVAQQQSKSLKKQTLEFTMDFPDSEQYYNPRNRRWYFSKTASFRNELSLSSLPFDLDLQYEISYHFLMETFHQTFCYFDTKREIIDFFVFELLKKGFFQEFDSLSLFTRFSLSFTKKKFF